MFALPVNHQHVDFTKNKNNPLPPEKKMAELLV